MRRLLHRLSSRPRAETSTTANRRDAIQENQTVDTTEEIEAPDIPVIDRIAPNPMSSGSTADQAQVSRSFQYEISGQRMEFDGFMELLNSDIRRVRDQVLTDMFQGFQYEPLDPSRNHIRVLDLQPGIHNDAFQCTLRTVLLDDRPSYEALSYTWGENISTAALFINTVGSKSITRNLDEALRHIRSETQMKTLWIDAVCIDQQNDDEKASQVQKMLEIYRSASRVLVWLGPKGDNSDLAIDLIERMPTVDFGRLRSALTAADLREWDALRSLYRRPWWRRIWVVQESAIPSKEPLVGCGSRWLPWGVHEKAYTCIQNQLTYLDFNLPREVIHTNVQKIFAMRRRVMRVGADIDIRTVLHDTQWFEATDSRDKVFAIYGLIAEQFRRYITIDYKKSVVDVYTSLAEYMINLDMDFLIPRTPSIMAGLPSWVSDWSSSNLLDGAVFWWPGDYSAGGPHRSPPMFSDVQGQAFFHGCVFSTILMRADTPPLESDNTVKDVLRTVENFERTLRAAQEMYLDLEVLQRQDPLWNNSFVKCLVADTDFNRGAWDFTAVPTGASGRADRAPNDFWDLMQVLQGRVSVPAGFEPTLPAEERRHKYAHRLIRALRVSLPMKTFFVTSWGLLGLATDKVEVGDCIAIIFGVQMPVILRPVDEYGTAYRLIGPAYVQHIMDGEAMKFEAVERAQNLQEDDKYNICLL